MLMNLNKKFKRLVFELLNMFKLIILVFKYHLTRVRNR